MTRTFALLLGLATLAFVFVPATAEAGHDCVYKVEWAPCWGGYAYSHAPAPAYVPPVNSGYTAYAAYPYGGYTAAHPSTTYPYGWTPYASYPRYAPAYGYGYGYNAYTRFAPRPYYGGGYSRGGWVSVAGPRGGFVSVGW